MSRSLYWQLPPSKVKKHHLDDSLKYVLIKRFPGLDGCENVTLDKRALDFLDGIIAITDSKNYKDLYNSAVQLEGAIRKYGEVVIFLES